MTEPESPRIDRKAFLSYAREDAFLVHTAARLLRACGTPVLLDSESIDFGERWEAVIKDAIDECERFVVFWSNASSQSSEVDREWRTALSLGKKIVPIQLDNAPLPAELAQFQGLMGLTDELRAAAASYERVTAKQKEESNVLVYSLRAGEPRVEYARFRRGPRIPRPSAPAFRHESLRLEVFGMSLALRIAE